MGATVKEIQARFPDDRYVAFHAPRYAVLLSLLRNELARHGGDGRVLDIGNSPFSELAAERLGTRIDNLGLHGEFETPVGQSHWFDLNQAADPATWRTDLPAYDVIVFAEVIEHLHTAPQLVLRFLRTLLSPGGSLIVQTPNAAVLHNRVQLLLGRNPFEMIREQTNDPGHFREYTRKELLWLAQEGGFGVADWSAHSYFDYRFRAEDDQPLVGSVLNTLYAVLPPTLRPGQTAVLRPSGPARQT